MNIKSLFMAISAIALTSAVSVAQTRIIEHEYSEFDAISVSDGFKVTLVEKDGYNAKFKVSDALESYLECYVKGGTLYIGLDDKSIPKKLRNPSRVRILKDLYLKPLFMSRHLTQSL